MKVERMDKCAVYVEEDRSGWSHAILGPYTVEWRIRRAGPSPWGGRLCQ
jgi:hypothetical protein